jgi:hypothetical protein
MQHTPLQLIHPQAETADKPQRSDDGYINAVAPLGDVPALAAPTKPAPKPLPWRTATV